MHIVIIGSGIAGITLAEELRKAAPEAAVTVLTHEGHGYYSRPMLSHGFSRADVETKIILRSIESLAGEGVEVRAGSDVLSVDPETKSVLYRRAGAETTLGYDTLVLATGSAALIPPPFRSAGGLYRVLNSLDDLIELRRHRETLLARGETPRWAIVGGGLIGCEVGSDLARAGDRISLLHALPRLMERQLAEEDSTLLLKVLQDQGIEVRLDAAVQGFEAENGTYGVKLEDETLGEFHVILVACGFKPRTELAAAAGLETGRGIRVDAFLRTRNLHIHALGDVAECVDGRIYAYVMPIRHQAQWLARFLAGQTREPWQPPAFKPRAKVHGFTAVHPYLF